MISSLYRSFSAAALALLLFVATIEKPRAEVKLEMAYMPIVPCSQLFVIEGMGWAKEAGINLELTRFPNGPAIVQAIASGRRAALAIEKYLRGGKGRIEILNEKTNMREDVGLALDDETEEDRPRIEIKVESPEDRVKDFREVETGFSEEQALLEAVRCLRCDLEKE